MMPFLKSAASLTLTKDPVGLRAWLPVISHWLPPFLLSGGIFFMAGDYGSVAVFHWPATLLQYFFPSWPLQKIFYAVMLIRKSLHFLAYAVLFAAYGRALRWQFNLGRWPLVLLTLSICLLISGVDEGRQAFYPSRTGHLGDVLLDMSGAVTAAAVFWPWLRSKET
jgi:VanZ family protein